MDLRCSVIIPARNASHELGECLAALADSSAGVVPSEVIVVEDGSTDDTGSVATAHGANVINLPGLGPAAARNAGAKAASGDILVFFDADCVPAPGCLAALLAPFEDPCVVGVRGAYSSRQQALVARLVQMELDEKQARLASSGQIAVVDTACAAYRRALFAEEGGFDERFPATSAEDVEFSFRLAGKGRLLLFAPDAIVWHRHPETLTAYLWRKLRFGYFRARLYCRFPARLKEDGYTPRLMPVQIGLAGALVAAVLAGLLTPVRFLPGLVVLLAFLSTTLPTVSRVWPRDRQLAALVPGLLLARSLAQGFGLLFGFAALALGEGWRGRTSRSTRAHAMRSCAVDALLEVDGTPTRRSSTAGPRSPC